jgi:leucyl/phenylalanyl-tRNA---protein transferase
MRRSPRPPLLLHPGAPPLFPNPEECDEEGLVAIGGDLTVERLLAAYRAGIFPWFNEGNPLLWWSPDPRAVLFPEEVHVSRSMRRELRRVDVQLTWNRSFLPVMQQCGQREEGTWILPEMIYAYDKLHRLGHAHSLEVWSEGQLIGGLYGVQVGSFFAAESMFHRKTNASKIALIATAHTLAQAGVRLIDVQFKTDHLATLGVTEISRTEYLRRLAVACRAELDLSELEATIGVT